MADSFCASKHGLKLVDRARRKKRWNKTAEVWCSAALTSRATLSRFWARHPIRSETFISICDAVGVCWEEVVSTPAATPHQPPTQSASMLDVPQFNEEAFSIALSKCPDHGKSGQSTNRHDWGMAPAADLVWGRSSEREQLQRWILQERCRWVGLFGMGGIGKTTLAAQFARTHSNRFDRVIWRSLSHAPTLDEMLTDLLEGLASPQATAVSAPLGNSLEGRMQQLLTDLQQHRCLIIFDHVESILAAGDRTGRYRDGYEDYRYLFRCIGETPHQSCMLITSRERLKEQCCLEGKYHPVHCLQLDGVLPQAGQTIVEAKGDFTGRRSEWCTLIEYYGGNPLVLQIVAPFIRDTFDGQIAMFLEFLHQSPFLLDDLCSLLSQHFDRLSPLEQYVMYWIAIHQNTISLCELQQEMGDLADPAEMMQAIAALQRRSLIEKVRPHASLPQGDRMPRLTQKPMVMQFVTWRFMRIINQDQLQEFVAATISAAEFPLEPSDRDIRYRAKISSFQSR